MSIPSLFLLVALLAASPAQDDVERADPQHFIFFNVDRHRIREANFLETEAIAGAQLKYTWRELEPERDRYDLGPLMADLAFLIEHGKRLFIQIQDVTFDQERVNVPDYLREDPAFGGGVALQYDDHGGDASEVVPEGRVARRWDPAVRTRFIKLLQVLGEAVDGKIEGVNLPETSIGFGSSGEHDPEEFTHEGYVEAVKAIMTAARDAFPNSHVIQYANFMPGEWLPWDDHGYLRSIYEHADEIGAGVGGPDILPHRKGQQNHSLRFIAERGPGVVAGNAVQWGNLDEINPATGQPVTVDELYQFARDRLRLNYIFWGIQEPHYSTQILPFLHDLALGDGR